MCANNRCILLHDDGHTWCDEPCRRDSLAEDARVTFAGTECSASVDYDTAM